MGDYGISCGCGIDSLFIFITFIESCTFSLPKTLVAVACGSIEVSRVTRLVGTEGRELDLELASALTACMNGPHPVVRGLVDL